MSCRAQLLGFPVVLHPIKKTPKGGEHCAQLPIHHQIGNFLIACVMMCASSKICIYRIFPVSLPPLWVAVKETTILLTRPPIETYWLYKVQLNSLKHQSHSVSKSSKMSYWISCQKWFLARKIQAYRMSSLEQYSIAYIS